MDEDDALLRLFLKVDGLKEEDRTMEQSAVLLCLLNGVCPCCWQEIPKNSRTGRAIEVAKARRERLE